MSHHDLTRYGRRMGRGAVLAAAFTISLLCATLAPAPAAAPGDFDLSGSRLIIPTGETGQIVVTLTPNDSTVGAVSATASWESTDITVIGCEALIAFAVCNVDQQAKTIRFAAVNSTYWQQPVDLVAISVRNDAVAERSPVDISILEANNQELSPISGEATPGSVATGLVGDPSCDGRTNIVDALLIAQYSVGNRTDTGVCPIALDEINAQVGDVNCDDASNIVDALLIAQYDVGNRQAVSACPLTDPLTQIRLG